MGRRGTKGSAASDLRLLSQSEGMQVPAAPTYVAPVVAGWPEWAPRFLELLAEHGSLIPAAFMVGKAKKTIRDFRKADAIFAEEYEKAVQISQWQAEIVYRHRSMHGWVETTVLQDGDNNVIRKQTKTRFSPAMLEKQLAVMNPGKWGAKKTVVENRTDITTVVGVQHMMADPRIAELVCELDERMADKALPVSIVDPVAVESEPEPESESGGESDAG